MHKLVILIEALDDWVSFEDKWPEFLHISEEMPGLRREATSRVERVLYGGQSYVQMHELYFDTLQDMEKALASPQGRAAGQLLQQITGGRVVLFYADHKEDDLANIHKYKQNSTSTN